MEITQNTRPIQAGTINIQATSSTYINSPSVSIGSSQENISLNYGSGTIVLSALNSITISAPAIYLQGQVENLPPPNTINAFLIQQLNQVWRNPIFMSP